MFSAVSVTQSEPGRRCWAEIITSELGTARVEAVAGEGGFFGQLSVCNLSYLRIAQVTLRGAAVRGMRRRSGGGREAFSWLAASLGGGFEVCYNTRSAVVEPGRMAILDARRTYVTTFAPNADVVWVRVPHELLSRYFSGPDQVLIDGGSGAGRILFDTLKVAVDEAAHLPAESRQPVADGLVRMIGAIGAGAEHVCAPKAHVSPLERVKSFVLENLADDSLSAKSVAVASGLTARYVNKLFEREGSSLMRWVWQQRLKGARAALTSGDESFPSIGSVAYSYGFKSASHFSHAFRRTFGHSPRTSKKVKAEPPQQLRRGQR